MNQQEFITKCLTDDANNRDGKEFLNLYFSGSFDIIPYGKVDDEIFTIMSYDYGISDYYMALIFNESNHKIAKRRKFLGIPKGADRHRKWVDVDNRGRIELNKFLNIVVTKERHYG